MDSIGFLTVAEPMVSFTMTRTAQYMDNCAARYRRYQKGNQLLRDASWDEKAMPISLTRKLFLVFSPTSPI